MDVKVPEVGESIQEALIAEWLKNDGDKVSKDDILCELETDKINVEIPAEADGILKIKVEQGKTVKIGSVIASIEADSGAPKDEGESPAEPAKTDTGETEESDQEKSSETTSAEDKAKPQTETEQGVVSKSGRAVNPAARQLAQEQGVDLETIKGSGRDGRVLLDDVRKATEKSGESGVDDDTYKKLDSSSREPEESDRPTTREPMSPIRQRISARLLEARQQTAMLTTFNEADMSKVKSLRAKHQDHFTAKHGIKLGLMSFFVKATVEALREYPAVNARIDNQEIVYHHYYDIGIAVGTDRGLVVPILRNADRLTFAEIEKQIASLADRANMRKLTLSELEGGTFTITNGGIYGSMMSTPILNPPQCGVLGMHAIQDRAVVRDQAIVIRPIMYLALSYDHRLIDGREAVAFLKLIKEYIEDPEELMLEL
jgi:2-oxoglutarate dehydrogenase E2 component (dihydrolipoamide succinyltransferase)